MSGRFYITTPIYYPNGEPHLGHVYTTLAADVLARYRRLRGEAVHFLTGTDWHGIKMVKSAEEKGTTPQALAEVNDKAFIDFWKELGVTNDDYIRTSEPRHVAAVGKIVEHMLAKGDIYLGAYEGWYDEGQEEFITETEAKAADYKSTVSGRPLTRYKEATYFFKLGKYAEQVYAAIESDRVRLLPQSRKNEVLSKLKGWTADLSISRSTLKWGIAMPNDPEHVLYVWIDALSNYITALGYQSDDDTLFRQFWPVDVHMIGKEILWFHAVYWPAMLLSLGVELPRVLYAHGWWTSEGRKMSKSLGNFIDQAAIRQSIGTYSLDGVRYYLLRAAPFGADLDWKETELAAAYTELGNVVGNLLNRVINMVGKYREGKQPAVGAFAGGADAVLRQQLKDYPKALTAAYDNFELQRAALLPVELARTANAFIDAAAPWKLAKDPAQSATLDYVLHLCVDASAAALAGLLPILPGKAAAGLRQLGIGVEGKSFDDLLAHDILPGQPIGPGEVLFPRIETKKE